MINSLKNLKSYFRKLGVGLDNIDLNCAKKNIIIKKNTNNSADSVCELVLSLILSLIRKISTHNYKLKEEYGTKIWDICSVVKL